MSKDISFCPSKDITDNFCIRRYSCKRFMPEQANIIILSWIAPDSAMYCPFYWDIETDTQIDFSNVE